VKFKKNGRLVMGAVIRLSKKQSEQIPLTPKNLSPLKSSDEKIDLFFVSTKQQQHCNLSRKTNLHPPEISPENHATFNENT
jgi:hypothetical protein